MFRSLLFLFVILGTLPLLVSTPSSVLAEAAGRRVHRNYVSRSKVKVVSKSKSPAVVAVAYKKKPVPKVTSKATKGVRARLSSKKVEKLNIAKVSNLPKANKIAPLPVEPVVQDVPYESLESFESVGPFRSFNNGNYYEVKADGRKEVLTLDRDMQSFSEELLALNRVAWGAIVAIDPKTGAVLSLAGHSDVEPNGQAVATRNTFPAASLFKIITAAAAVETSGYNGNTEVAYRGGTYTLGKHNYLPSVKSDRNRMSLGLALGKSCNPVFARVALNNLSTDVIKRYANNFGFSKQLAKDFSLRPSTLEIDTDSYSLARTAAGFGSAFISPVHASLIGGAVGNHGLMMKPYIVDHVNDRTGKVISKTKPELLGRSVSESTASELLDMMSVTISDGTARRHFKSASPLLRNIPVAGKTGTLNGKNPKGLYHWFIAVAPMNNPRIGIASLVIDNGRAKINAVGLGKKYLERFFEMEHSTEQAKTSVEEKAPEKIL